MVSGIGPFGQKLLTLPGPAEALPGRDESIPVPVAHYVNGRTMTPPFPEETESVVVGMGCFWGGRRTGGNVILNMKITKNAGLV